MKQLNSVFCALFLGLGLGGFSQEELTPFQQESWELSFVKAAGDTLELPVYIDFTQPLSNFFTSHAVRIAPRNAPLPIGPGNVVFDGLDLFGEPYSSGANSRGRADSLCLKPINLNYPASDSITCSFYFLAGGLGDAPEQTDSLLFQGYNQIDSAWQTVWFSSGKSMVEYERVNVVLSDPVWFTNGTQFRWINKGGLTGNLDNWNLTYVQFMKNGSAADKFESDLAILPSTPTLLKKYTAIPWLHSLGQGNSIFRDTLRLDFYNRSSSLLVAGRFGVEVSLNNSVVFAYEDPTSLLDLESLEYEFHNLVGGQNGLPNYTLPLSIAVPFPKFEVCLSGKNEVNPDIHVSNDTSCFVQDFSDYYALDDGSPELAYGINESGARIALKFNSLRPDTLVGVRFRFNPTVESLDTKSFILSSWKDLNSNTILTENNGFSVPKVGPESNNGFVEYYFEEEAVVSNAFFVGVIQTSSRPLGIGFDLNTIQNNELFYSLSGLAWVNSSLAGMPQIQPIFKSEKSIASIGELEPNRFEFYPNPAHNFVHWNPTPGEVILFDYSGRQLKSFSGEVGKGDVRDLPKGIYLLRLENRVGKLQLY